MRGWDELLDRLASGPRENGTQELADTAAWLAARLREAGWDVELWSYRAHPHETQMLGVVALVLGAAYFRLLRAHRFLPALLAAIAVPLLALAVVERGWPALGGIGATEQSNVVATLSPPDPVRRLVLSAHYDTKTELLDHVARAPAQILGAPVFGALVTAPLLGLFRSRRGRPPGRFVRACAVAAPVYGAALALTLSVGAVLPARSHGALDDGGACAVLLRAAEDMGTAPPARTEVQIVLFSGEELGARGAHAWTKSRFPKGPDLPTRAVNFELIGSSPRFLVGSEISLTRNYRPPGALLDLLDESSLAAGGERMHRTRGGGLTDAVAFHAAGIPAATVVGREGAFLVPRGMHGPSDDRSRLDLPSLELARAFVGEIVRRWDAASVQGPSGPVP